MTARRHPLPPPTPEINLLIEILRGTPRLPGAACRDHPGLFAATVVEGQGSRRAGLTAAREQARAICGGCEALDACASWVRSTPEARRPAGIVAGHTPGHPAMKRNAAHHNPEGTS